MIRFDDIASVAGAGASAGGGFYALRWLIKWMTERADKRQADLDREHASLDVSWKDYRIALERRMASVERQNRALLSAFQHVSASLIRHAPQDPALLTAERIMAAAFPNDFTMAAQMAGGALDMTGEQP